mmetsp:Transcript_11835/g.27449  ORF Transcript_11835/g.27449 Transcript_11835/m.27449 type:complete len:84 (-) Transcript_11835:319-570(-)
MILTASLNILKKRSHFSLDYKMNQNPKTTILFLLFKDKTFNYNEVFKSKLKTYDLHQHTDCYFYCWHGYAAPGIVKVLKPLLL